MRHHDLQWEMHIYSRRWGSNGSLNKGINPLSFQGWKTSVTTDDSRVINFDEDCKVIISASGMCDAGRIKHHLKHTQNPEIPYSFVDTAIEPDGHIQRCCEMKLFWWDCVRRLKYANAGNQWLRWCKRLIEWKESFWDETKHVFVTYGDDTVMEILPRGLKKSFGYDATAPLWKLEYDWRTGVSMRLLVFDQRQLLRRKQPRLPAYAVIAGRRLTSVIRRMKAAPIKIWSFCKRYPVSVTSEQNDI